MLPTQVVVLALVQALTEFLPVSSSAHLVLVRWLMGWEDPGLSFDIALHVGTLLALVAYFGSSWIRILGMAAGRRWLPVQQGHRDRDLSGNPRLLWLIAAATVPAALAGMAAKDLVESHLRSPGVIGWMLVGVGYLIWEADRRGARAARLDSLGAGQALLIGCAQAVALIPGTSRSGITIAAGLAAGLEREAAARFSFLMAMPVVLGAGLLALADLPAGLQGGTVGPGSLALGIAVSAVAGYGVIRFFLGYLRQSSLAGFVYYRWVLGIVVLGIARGLAPAVGVWRQSGCRSRS